MGVLWASTTYPKIAASLMIWSYEGLQSCGLLNFFDDPIAQDSNLGWVAEHFWDFQLW